MDAAQTYRRFASAEARGESPCYGQRATGVAEDPELRALVDQLPPPKCQPNLVFAWARYCGITAGPLDDFRTELIASWPEVGAIVLPRRTQANSPRS